MTSNEVIFDEPGRDARDSIPLGNGEVGANVWTEPGGDVHLYLARTDAWSENCRLLKLGEVVLRCEEPFAGEAFEQRLVPEEGAIHIAAGSGEARRELLVYVDAHTPTVRLHLNAERRLDLSVAFRTWRTEPRELDEDEIHSAYGLQGKDRPIVVRPDTIEQSVAGQRVVWYHCNEESIWAENLAHQDLADLDAAGPDPLRGRTFGGAIYGANLIRESPTRLVADDPATTHDVAVTTHTAVTDTVDEWRSGLMDAVGSSERPATGVPPDDHCEWWRRALERSYIRVFGSEAAETVSQGYNLQRYVTLAAGQGTFPIKFNGSLFTVDWKHSGEDYDPDYRSWGGHYWFQNTRLVYWSMIAAGDFDSMDPLFAMYDDALPLARARTEQYFDHSGAYFPETMTFWGTYTQHDWGYEGDDVPSSVWSREDAPPGHAANRHLRYYWQGGLELTHMGLERYRHERDDGFLETLLPLAEAVVEFYDEHYPREDGQLRIEPAQSLETYWDVVDPLPEIAGLDAVLEGLLALPNGAVDPGERDRWVRLREELPPLPKRSPDGESVLAPAAEVRSEARNSENPELYAVFPYHRYGLGAPEIEVARRTYRQREQPGNAGWNQDPIHAARLGLTDEAARLVGERFADGYEDARFPAFWGPNFDWIPDQDHGSVGMIALQRMLLQADGDVLWLFPAWPAEWDVEFTLHAPMETTLEGVYRDGELTSLSVTPAERRADLTVLDPD